MNISILLPYRDRKKNLMILLRQIKRNLFFFKEKLEVILIDLGSKENIQPELSSFPFVSYEYIDYKETFCKAWGLNLAFKKARYDWIFMLDVDCIFFEKFLVNAGKYIDAEDKNRFYIFEAVAGLNETLTRIIHEKGNITNRLKGVILEFFEKMDFLQGAGNILVHRDLYEQLSGYDEKIIGWGREDSDFYNRLLAAGAQKATIPLQPDQCLFHLFHKQEDLTYNNAWIFSQNDFVEQYNLKHKVTRTNGEDEWGNIAIRPDQYRYESLLSFEIVKKGKHPPVLKAGSRYLNNPDNPTAWEEEFEPVGDAGGPAPNVPVILLGGGLNYAYRALAEKKHQVLILEKYKQVRQLAIRHNGIEAEHFINTDFSHLVDLLVRLKFMTPKRVLVHKPSLELDSNWYGEVINFFKG